MGQPAFSLNVNFESIVCCECGLTFAAPDGFFRFRRDDHRLFYCPSGHSQHFPAKTEAERLRDELAAEKLRKEAALARANAAEQAKVKAERKTKRIEKRIRAGVCPCCNRTFQNLARHMNTKHPDDTNVVRLGALPLPK